MKKIRLEVELLQVQSFVTGERRSGNGTVKARSEDPLPVPAAPSDYMPCFPSGIDTGSMCTCGESHSGQPESCYDASCIHGMC